MKTSKPFSTISYLTETTLIEKLNHYIHLGKISFWAFVEHYPEEDEKKKHKHLIIFPDGQINTKELTDFLVEIDIANPLKPLACMPFSSSKWFDWYLYSSHNEDYLASKGQSRKFRYLDKDFRTSNEDFFQELIHTMDLSKLNRVARLKNAVEKGVPFEQMVSNGQIPIQQINAFKTAYEMLTEYQGTTFRNDRQTHSPKIDSETGEIID